MSKAVHKNQTNSDEYVDVECMRSDNSVRLDNVLLCKTRQHCEKCRIITGKSVVDNTDMRVASTQKHKHYVNSVNTYSYTLSDKVFTGLGHLKKHSSEQIYKIETYDKAFLDKSRLRQHGNVHKQGKLHHCKFCDKSFRFASLLKSHKRLHIGEKPYRCSFCD